MHLIMAMLDGIYLFPEFKLSLVVMRFKFITHPHNSHIQIMNCIRLILLVLLLFNQIACYPLIEQMPVNFQLLCNGAKPIRMVRYHTLRYNYQLVGIKDLWLDWTNYPEFNDRFQIDTPQYVKISYSITVSFYPLLSHFMTRLLINNKLQQRFTVVSTNQYERTHAAQHWVWMEPGNYNLQMQYRVWSVTPTQYAGSIDWLTPFFEIMYFKNG